MRWGPEHRRTKQGLMLAAPVNWGIEQAGLQISLFCHHEHLVSGAESKQRKPSSEETLHSTNAIKDPVAQCHGLNVSPPTPDSHVDSLTNNVWCSEVVA